MKFITTKMQTLTSSNPKRLRSSVRVTGSRPCSELRESGVEVKVGLQPTSSSKPKAEEEGLSVVTPAEATQWADVVMILIPDEKQAVLWANEIEPHVRKGQHIMFGHGFNIHYNLIRPSKDVDVSLSAPKGPGHTLRDQYTRGFGLPGLVAIAQNATGKHWTKLFLIPKRSGIPAPV